MTKNISLKQCIVLVLLTYISASTDQNEQRVNDPIITTASKDISMTFTAFDEDYSNDSSMEVKTLRNDATLESYIPNPSGIGDTDNRNVKQRIDIDQRQPVIYMIEQPLLSRPIINDTDTKIANAVVTTEILSITEPQPIITDSTKVLNHNITSKIIEEPQKPNTGDILIPIDECYYISATTHILLALSGLYLLFYGFKTFRISIIMFGFHLAYYTTIIIVTHTSYFTPISISHEIGIILTSLSFGLLFLVLTSIFETVNYFVFGSAVGMLISIVYAQFFLDFSNPSDKFCMLGVYVVVCSVVIICGRRYIRQTIISSCALIGSITVSVNLGILSDDLSSFESRDKLPLDAYDDFVNYLVVATVLFVAGTMAQWLIRERMIESFYNRKLEEIRGVSFLE